MQAGTVSLLVLTKVSLLKKQLNDDKIMLFIKMCEKHNPYGDGKACEKIVSFMRKIISY